MQCKWSNNVLIETGDVFFRPCVFVTYYHTKAKCIWSAYFGLRAFAHFLSNDFHAFCEIFPSFVHPQGIHTHSIQYLNWKVFRWQYNDYIWNWNEKANAHASAIEACEWWWWWGETRQKCETSRGPFCMSIETQSMFLLKFAIKHNLQVKLLAYWWKKKRSRFEWNKWNDAKAIKSKSNKRRQAPFRLNAKKKNWLIFQPNTRKHS